MSRDRIGMADQVLSAAARHRLPVGDDFRAGVAVFGLGEIFVTMRVMLLGGLGGASRERQHQSAGWRRRANPGWP